MVATFKETLTSLQDPKYGQVIISRSLKFVLWYWTKYLLLLAIFPLLLTIFAFTYFLPQLPRLAEKNFPEGTLGARNHQLFSTIPQPYQIWQGQNFAFILNLEGHPEDLDRTSNGVLILKDKFIAKTENGRTQIQTFSNIPDFSLDKYQLATWLANHRYQIWLVGTVAIILITAIFIGGFWLFRLGSFSLWTLVFWAGNKISIKKHLSYLQIFNLVVYASIFPLLLSAILFFAPNGILSLVTLGLFLFFSFSWLKNIPS